MWEYVYSDELYHYGVKGMKWGVRKFQQKSRDLDNKKAAYKKAKKAYGKAFRKANNRSMAAFSPIEKHREANDKRWGNVYDKANALNKAKSDYKSAKNEFRKNTTVGQKINRGAKATGKILKNVGVLAVADQLYTGGVGRKVMIRGARYVKNAALNKMFNTTILDVNGNVIGRYNN